MIKIKKTAKKVLMLIVMSFVFVSTLCISTFAKPVQITSLISSETNEGGTWDNDYIAWCYTLDMDSIYIEDSRDITYINALLYIGLSETYIQDNFGDRVPYWIEIGWTTEYLSNPFSVGNIEYFPFYEEYTQGVSEGIYLSSSTPLEYNVNISFANVYNSSNAYIYIYIVYSDYFIDYLDTSYAYGSRAVQLPYGSNEEINIDYLNSRIEYLETRVFELTNELNASQVNVNVLTNQLSVAQSSLNSLRLEYNALLQRYNDLANSSAELSFKELLWTIASSPFESFKTIWNVDFLGVNIASFSIGLLLIGLLIFIVKRIF